MFGTNEITQQGNGQGGPAPRILPTHSPQRSHDNSQLGPLIASSSSEMKNHEIFKMS